MSVLIWIQNVGHSDCVHERVDLENISRRQQKLKKIVQHSVIKEATESGIMRVVSLSWFM